MNAHRHHRHAGFQRQAAYTGMRRIKAADRADAAFREDGHRLTGFQQRLGFVQRLPARAAQHRNMTAVAQ